MAEAFQWLLNMFCTGATVMIFFGWWVFLYWICPPQDDDHIDHYDRL